MFSIECFEKTVLNTLENIQKNVCSGVFFDETTRLHVQLTTDL